MTDRQRLAELIDHLHTEWGYVSLVDPALVADGDVGFWLEQLEKRRRCFVEGRRAGWIPA